MNNAETKPVHAAVPQDPPEQPATRPGCLRFQSALIVTYGRSGSTLLQGILNSIDGCLIRGENYNFCLGLFKSYMSMLAAKSHSGKTPQSPWYGSDWDENLFLSSVSTLVQQLLLGKRSSATVQCYGFKEIRYVDLAEEEFTEYLSFLSKIFPNVAFIFNTRRLDDVVASEWWRSNPEESRAKLSRTEMMFRSYAATRENCFIIDYGDVVTQSPTLMAMFEFLGAPYAKEEITKVLSLRHSFRSTGFPQWWGP